MLNTVSELESYKIALDKSAIVAITDIKGTITYVNDKFCEISKYSREELINSNHRILKSGFHNKDFYKSLWTTISKGEIWSGQLKNKAKDGSYYWVDTTIVPFLDDNKKPYKYLSIRFDITEQKELENSLEKKVNERTQILIDINEENAKNIKTISNQNKQLEDFCNIITHNLRSPIANLTLLVDFIKDTSDIEEQKFLVDKLSPVLNNLNDTFNELFETLQVKQNTGIKNEFINLKDCIQNILNGLEGKIYDSKALIEININEVPEIYFPPKYLHSILFNLISNAFKYKSPNRTLHVTICSKKIDNRIILSVGDNGLGMDLKTNGDKLFKIGKTFHHHPEAKGFGLHMTKTQIEALDGKIWAESKPDLGTTFYVEFKMPDLSIVINN